MAEKTQVLAIMQVFAINEVLGCIVSFAILY